MNERVLTEDEAHEIYLCTPITGARLSYVNKILVRYGFEPMPECNVGEVISHITPMEMGRYLNFCTELAFVMQREK